MKFSLIVTALTVGFLSALILIQRDERFIKATQEQLKALFEKTFDCIVTDAQIVSMNLLTGTLVARNVKVQARDTGSWSWAARSVTVRSSWMHILLSRTLGLTIFLHDVQAASLLVDGRPSIMGHLEKIVAGAPGLPVVLRDLQLKNVAFQCDEGTWCADVFFDADFNRQAGKQIDFSCTLRDGLVKTLDSKVIMHGIQSHMSLTKKNDIFLPEGDVLCKAKSLYVDGGSIVVELSSKNNKIRLALKDADNKQLVTAHGTLDTYSSFTLQMHVGIPIGKYFFPVHQASLLKDIHLVADFLFEKRLGESIYATSHILFSEKTLGTMTSDFLFKDSQCKASFAAHSKQAGTWSGIGMYDWEKNEGNILVKLCQPIPLFSSGFQIHPEQTALQIGIKNSMPASLLYRLNLFDALKQQSYLLQGNGELRAQESFFAMKTDSGFFDASLQYADAITGDARYKTTSGKDLFTFTIDNKQVVRASIDYDVIRSVLNRLLGIDAHGEGILHLEGMFQKNMFTGNVRMHDACIRLVPSYNFVQNIQALFTYDLAAGSLTIQDGLLELHGGTITVPRATMILRHDGNVDFFHVPFKAEKVIVTIHKDCFVQLSGVLMLTKRDDTSSMSGCIILDKGQLKKNIFSLITSRQFFEPVVFSLGSTIFDGRVRLIVATQKPLTIKTSFLDTQADLSLLIEGTMNDPHITGKIALSRGSLAFPYRPLFITHGILNFTPPGLTNPDISFVAKGRVRHFDITLRVGGTLDHPHLSLESTPPLTDEQIITLLLIGSENGSLSLIMPTLLMNNIQHLLFGPEQSLKKLETYFKSLLAPLKTIRFVPSFTDQSGRGGLRGAIEVDISDQLHAVIQKNFSQPEDTKFEVEYCASDDLTLRALKDERGDLGGEFEWRWKF